MIQPAQNESTNGGVEPLAIQRSMADAVRAALRRHMLLGESVAVSDGDGGVKILGPEEIRRVLEANG